MAESYMREMDKEKLRKAFDFSHFDVNAVLRGVQLTLVGGKQSYTPGHMPLDTILLADTDIEDSSKGPPESRPFHIPTLPSSSHRCGLGHSYPLADCHSSKFQGRMALAP